MPDSPDPYLYFLSNLGKWPSALAMASQWFVNLNVNRVPALQGGLLNSNLLALEPGSLSWAIDSGTTGRIMSDEFQNMPDRLIGCVFAREVNFPGETAKAAFEGLNYGGLMAPPTVSGRESYNTFDMRILETNASFLDFVIRPWIILTSQFGLIARQPNSPSNIRSPLLQVYMLAKMGQDISFQPRKIYNFVNAAPVDIEGEQYSYEQEGLKYSTVKFVYDRYFITSGQSENSSVNNSATTTLPSSIPSGNLPIVSPEAQFVAVKTA